MRYYSHNYNNNSDTAASPSPATSNEGLRQWNSPVPYLFGGVALMVCLITVALVILACTSRKSSSSSSSGPNSRTSVDHEVDDRKQFRQSESVVDSEPPKINVVIMAGDDKPTYLANAVLSLS